MRVSRGSVYIIATSSAVYGAWRLLRWRARTRARKTVERVQSVVREGPLIDPEDPQTRRRILDVATRRASKWISLSEAQQMAGQVGGVSKHKKPLLSLQPDYILKPLQTDHRGIREVAFYEAIHHANQTAHAYTVFLNGKEPKKNIFRRIGDLVDTLAVALAILLQDSAVMDSEEAIREAWKLVKKEVEALSRLDKFTAPYYGLVGQEGQDEDGEDVTATQDDGRPYGIAEDAHLLLQDLTSNFSKPNVIDLKIGTQSYEPDATEEKKEREFSKYPQQSQFGFRVVGMRVYEPDDPGADENGFVYHDKLYGRSLRTRKELLEAFRRYLSAGNYANGVVTTQVDNGTTTTKLRTKTASNLLFELRILRRWFEENDSLLRFYASSLLIVYEGDNRRDNNDLVSVKMIDFGRVRRVKPTTLEECETDVGYQAGLKTIYGLLSDLVAAKEE